ncbi:MAG: FecR domain-containing protein [Rhodocyclaceae bacterium]|nr:FecR domain-containing protein [Rhodocyclaceae bacterium]
MNALTRKSLQSVVLSLLLAVMAAFPALAAEENPDTGKPFANVWRLKGDVFATGKQGVPRRLKEGGTVNVGEKIRAASNGEAVLKTPDGGIVAVRPGAEFIPERFAAEGKSTDRQILRLITGSLRLITGWIGQLNRNDHRVLTPSATIGIRGTDHEPYVLPASMANSTYRQGTYDKVNRGETLLDANGGNVAIESGKVGFARDPATAGTRTRALMTILLPVLLTQVPDFYVPGSFDQELDRYSESIDTISAKQLENRTAGSRPAAGTDTQADSGAEPPAVAIVGCPPKAIAEAWLGRFDRAIVRRDVKTILNLFAPEIVAQATVRSGNETKSLEFNRDEMVNSTLSAIASLKNYSQRRVSLEASFAAGETEASCKQIVVKSIAIEQGLMNDKPYRFEALEEYLLEERNGEWLAIKAQTTQR